MMQKFRKLSLESQLFFSFMAVSVCLLLLSLSITLFSTITRQRQEIDKNISALAAYVASMDNVVSMLENGYPDGSANEALDSLSENFPDLNVIAIYNTTGLRFYHTNRKETGETFVGGEEEAILKGSQPYITIGYGTNGSQRRAFHSIRNSDGAIIGFVIASVFNTYISEQIHEVFPTYLLAAMVMLLVSILLSHGLVSLLRDSLMGHHPTELLDLYLRQDTVLNALEEGLVATDSTGSVVYANQAAENLFHVLPEKPEDPPSVSPDDGTSGQERTEPLMEGRTFRDFFPESQADREEIPESASFHKRFRDFFPESQADRVLASGTPSYHRACTCENRRLLVSEIPADTQTEHPVILTIINDQTEMETVMDELTGAKAMLDTLRAFNHEFLNKLHVILGYLQTGQTEEAINFIINSNLVSSQSIRQTADCLRVSKICALVIGKMMHAAELGILLTVSPDSRCLEKDLLLPVENYITIVGNLLENAIEELSAGSPEIREITLGIYCDPGCNIITCEDTGRGIRPDLIDRIYEKGVSSKGTNRGTGLFLIKQLVDSGNGEISIETEPGEGTCFTITFTERKHTPCTM